MLVSVNVETSICYVNNLCYEIYFPFMNIYNCNCNYFPKSKIYINWENSPLMHLSSLCPRTSKDELLEISTNQIYMTRFHYLALLDSMEFRSSLDSIEIQSADQD